MSVCPHHGGVLVERGHALEVRHLHGLASADSFACQECCQAADEGVHTGLQLRMRPGARERLTVRLARQVHVPADRVVGKDVRSVPRVWPTEAEGGNVDANELIAPEPVRDWMQSLRGCALDDHVGALEECGEAGQPLGALEVERHRLLAGVEEREL